MHWSRLDSLGPDHHVGIRSQGDLLLLANLEIGLFNVLDVSDKDSQQNLELHQGKLVANALTTASQEGHVLICITQAIAFPAIRIKLLGIVAPNVLAVMRSDR